MIHPILLHNVSKHDDTTRVLLPDHPPEILSGLGKRSLGRYEPTPLKIPLC